MTHRRIFVTGGGGFVGKTLLRRLGRIEGLEILALDRSGSVVSAGSDGRITIVRGDLLDPATYERALASCDCVLHLAAATGKALRHAQDRDTASGTEALVDACRRTGVERFLLVSSIAASFPDKRGYAYAAAKERAERAVEASGLRFAILRPTMIFGDGAPVLASLTALALLPAVVVPGTGRVVVQPVSVDDVVTAIVMIVERDWFHSETFELGGPERLTIEELLQRLRIERRGKRGGVLHLPLPMIQGPLSAAERLGLGAILPATAGQFSSFRNDGTVTPNRLQEAITGGLTPLDRLLETPPRAAAAPDELHRECTVFTRHLLGVHPDAMVVERYRSAVSTIPSLTPGSGWERALLGFARRGVMRARSADAYAALFAPASVLRQRLVILLAILEVHPRFSQDIDKALGGSLPSVIGRVGASSLAAVLFLVAGTLLLGPLRLALVMRGGRS